MCSTWNVPGVVIGVKLLCILLHWGVQLILAYCWARPASLAAGKSRGRLFLFLLILHFHSCSSFFPVPLFHLFHYLFYLFLFFSGRRHTWSTRVDMSLKRNTINQHVIFLYTFARLQENLWNCFQVIDWAHVACLWWGIDDKLFMETQRKTWLLWQTQGPIDLQCLSSP